MLSEKKSEGTRPVGLKRIRPLILLCYRFQCGAERPICAQCRRRGGTCNYRTNPAETHSAASRRKLTELQSQCDMYEGLLDALRSRQETEAAELLRRLRAGDALGCLVSEVRAGESLLRLSDDG